MARMYVDNGYDGVIVTPHYYSGVYDSIRPNNERLREELQEKIMAEGLDLTLYPGNEVYYDKNIARMLKEGVVSPMNGSSFVLAEFPMTETPLFVDELVYEMQMEGYLPIFAHVERYRYVQKDIGFLKPFLKKGCLMQMNLDSLVSESSRVRETAVALLENQMIQLVGTDTHQSEWRSPNVERPLSVLREMLSADEFDEIVIENPYRVLENRRVAIHCDFEEHKASQPKRGFFSRLFSSGGKR